MSLHSRRLFLRNSVLASAALSQARFVHASEQDQTQATSPNSKFNVAIVGVNGRGGEHIRGMMDLSNTQITHICDVDEAVGEKRCEGIEKATEGKRPKYERDLRRLLDDKSIDMITVATPNPWHALAGVWAMQAGKDAYIEKPVCHNIAEGSALIATARKYGRMCQVGTQCRSSNAVRGAMEFIHSGGIGEVKLARALCYKRRASIDKLGDYPIPSSVDFDLWSGPAPYTEPKLTRKKFHYDWHWQRLYGNGDSGNQGPHQTDIARWGLGVDTHPNSVITYGGRLGYQAERKDPTYVDAGDTANTEVSIYDFGNKCMVFETRGLSVNDSADEELNRLFDSKSGNKVGVVFYGSGGYVVQREYTHCIAFDLNFNIIKEFKGGGDHFANFVEACQKRDMKILNADVREGHLSAAISHLGNISYYLGEKNLASAAEIGSALAKIKSFDDNAKTLERTVAHLKKNEVDLDKYPLSLGPMLEFDPVKERFTNNQEANSWIGREYREGFVCPTADKV
jgi:Oxidoreductase family, NAD-binding Rossmann fold